jgi:hypothetical protein
MSLHTQSNDPDRSEQELRLLGRIDRFGCNNGDGKVLWHPDDVRFDTSTTDDELAFSTWASLPTLLHRLLVDCFFGCTAAGRA